MSDSGETLLTPEEAAARLHICTKVLRRLRQQGHIRYVAVTERKILYRPEDCDDYVQSRVRQAEMTRHHRPKGRRTANSGSGNIVSFTARRAARA